MDAEATSSENMVDQRIRNGRGGTAESAEIQQFRSKSLNLCYQLGNHRLLFDNQGTVIGVEEAQLILNVDELTDRILDLLDRLGMHTNQFSVGAIHAMIYACAKVHNIGIQRLVEKYAPDFVSSHGSDAISDVDSRAIPLGEA